ncbi:MAG: oligosaccharide flippase family protein [Thaumarchaeota archaeon]|nr:oligosaccharide flippase family protein [Nitrososphaerota archaeon]
MHTDQNNRAETIVRGVGSLTLQSVLNAVLGFVLLASLVRFLPQASYGSYGTYASVQVTVGIAGVVSGFGLSSAVVRFLAPSSSDEGGSGWGSAKAALYLTVALSAAVSLFLVGAAPYLSDYFAKSPSLAWAFYLGAAWNFTSSIATPVQALLQGMRRYTLLAKVLLGSRFVAVAIAVVGVALYQSLAVAIAAQIVYGLLVFFAALPVAWDPLRRADPRPYYGVVMKYAYLLGLAGLVGAVANNADIVVVGGYLSLGSLGVYNAAVQISSVLSSFFVFPLVTALFAETSFSSASEDEVRRGTSLAFRFSLVTLLPASLFAAAMAPQLFDLFSGGGNYSQGIPYLQLITLFYVFTAIQTIAIAILQGVSRTRQVLVVGAVTALGEVALSVSLVPTLGLAGAAISRVVIFLVGCSLSLYFIRQYLPKPVDVAFYAKALVASGGLALAVYIPSVMISNRVLTLVPYTVLGIGLYLVLAKLLKLLNDEDRLYLAHLLPVWLQWITRLI